MGDSASRNTVISERRTFLRQTFAGGIGITLMSGNVLASSGADSVCGNSSAAESLLMYLGMVNLILNEAFVGIHRRLTAKLMSCEKLYAELYKLLDDLCVELGRSRQSTSQAEQVRELVKAGQANLQLVQTNSSLPHREVTPALTALALV